MALLPDDYSFPMTQHCFNASQQFSSKKKRDINLELLNPRRPRNTLRGRGLCRRLNVSSCSTKKSFFLLTRKVLSSANLSLLAPWQTPTLFVHKWVLCYQIPFQGGRVPGKPGSLLQYKCQRVGTKQRGKNKSGLPTYPGMTEFARGVVNKL